MSTRSIHPAVLRVAQALCLLLLAAAAAAPNALVDQALDAGRIDLATALRYQVLSLRHPAGLPAEYVPSDAAVCGTPVVRQVLRDLSRVDVDVAASLRKALARPYRQASCLSSAGHFRIHYDTEGSNAVDSRDGDGNGTPDYVDAVAAIADRCRALTVGEMAFLAPPADGEAGGGPETDIYVSALSVYYGFTHPEDAPLRSIARSSYIEVDNDYDDPVFHGPGQAAGLDGLRVSLAHELFHAVQWGYYYGDDSSWWEEATATWMEEMAYPRIDNYLMYVPHFLAQPEVGLDRTNGGREYGAVLFPLFLQQRYDRSVMRGTWEAFARQRHGRPEALDEAIPDGLPDAFAEFAVWNYFTGDRHREGQYYEDGARYTGLRLTRTDDPAKAAVRETGTLDRLSCRYLVMGPGQEGGGLGISAWTGPGQWRNQVLLVGSGDVADLPLGRGDVLVPDWDEHEAVVVVLAVTDVSGQGYAYDLSVRHDPDLNTGVAPEALSLKQSRPNPFRPGTDPAAVLPFALPGTSAVTRLSIYTAGGQLVRAYDLGRRAACLYDEDTWDGRNAGGEWVGSGIYYYVLEAGGQRAARTMAVVRE